MRDSEQPAAKLGLGLAKGVVAISLGVVKFVVMPFTVNDLANRR